MSDRTVHARYETKEIVRYDRAGKWFLESTAPMVSCRPLTVREAAWLAVEGTRESSGVLILGLSGGRAFDRLARDLLAHEHRLESA